MEEWGRGEFSGCEVEKSIGWSWWLPSGLNGRVLKVFWFGFVGFVLLFLDFKCKNGNIFPKCLYFSQ